MKNLGISSFIIRIKRGLKMYDIIIIGAGVSGSASARELSRYDLNILVLEKEEDVCCGTSKANSAIVHAGYDAANGSLMARLNVRGIYVRLRRRKYARDIRGGARGDPILVRLGRFLVRRKKRS